MYLIFVVYKNALQMDSKFSDVNINTPITPKKSSLKKYFFLFLLLVIGLFSLYIYWTYYNVFSQGDRRGTLIKITNKGDFFKTYEGEMWLSCRNTVNAEKFLFSVESKAIADSLVNLQDQCLQVQYTEYRGTFAWRGDSKYIITGFSKMAE